MQITIIGCGYVGMAAARYWRNQGWTVTGTTTTPDRVPQLEEVVDRAQVARGDDARALHASLQGQQAVLLSIGAPHPSAYEKTYLDTARTLVDVLRGLPEIGYLLYTGSYSVYGDRDGAWITETTPATPANRNGEILHQTEQILLAAANDTLNVGILRLGGIYGPGRELDGILGWACGMTLSGDGSDFSNWVHLDDIVGALTFALKERLSGIYNLVGDEPLPRAELLKRLCAQRALPPVRWEGSDQGTKPYNARVSNQKLKAAGYGLVHPQIHFEDPS